VRSNLKHNTAHHGKEWEHGTALQASAHGATSQDGAAKHGKRHRVAVVVHVAPWRCCRRSFAVQMGKDIAEVWTWGASACNMQQDT
jgi:hypothetical protein